MSSSSSGNNHEESNQQPHLRLHQGEQQQQQSQQDSLLAAHRRIREQLEQQQQLLQRHHHQQQHNVVIDPTRHLFQTAASALLHNNPNNNNNNNANMANNPDVSIDILDQLESAHPENHVREHEQQQQQHPQQQQQQQADGEEGYGRLLRNLINQNDEIRETLTALEKYVPFVLLLLGKLLFDHGAGIVVFAVLIGTFLHANSVVRNQVSRRERKNVFALSAVLVNVFAIVGLIYYVFDDRRLYNCAIFIPPDEVQSVYDLVWIVAVNDFILKFFALSFKVMVIFAPAKLLPYQKRGKFFLVIERVNQFHRELAPIQPWLVYLLNSYENTPGKVVGVLLVAVYMVNKGKFILSSAKSMKASLEKLMQTTTYGKSPTDEQLKTAGTQCPICYDTFRTPTLLHCKHIFCEECLITWFDRERTCPMCRAKVTEDPMWRDGSTSAFVQLF